RGEWIDPREYPAWTARAGANPPVVLPPPVPSPAAKPKLPVASPVRVAPPKPPAAKPPAARPPARPGEIPVEDG
ncbi:MAG: hypothetical protein NT031_05550, partial [Planctomycetota bacterium]|nr:hypothetical protein [Planctomycetota bacterium]